MQNHGRSHAVVADEANTRISSELRDNNTTEDSGRPRISTLVWIAASILLALYFARIDDWLFKNETFNNLAMGFDVAPDHPGLVALSEAGLANCEKNPVADLNHCHLYQGIITQNLYFAEPIQAFFGSFLAHGYGETPWMLAVHRVTVWSQITTALLAVALWLLFTVALPRAYGAIVSAATLALVLMGYFRRGDLTFVLPDPIADGVQAWEGLAMVAVIAVVFLVVPRAGILLASRPAAWASNLLKGNWRTWSLLGAMILIQMLLPLVLKPIVQGAALALLFLLLVRDVKEPSIGPRYLLIAVVLLLVLVSGDGSILLHKLEVPRYSAFLVFGAAMAYVSIRPRGRLILALPAVAVFHASVSALLGLALVCAELPIVLVRRRISPALVAGLLTFGCGLMITFGFQTNLLGISWEALLHLAEIAWHQPWRLLSFVLVLSLIAALTLWPLFSRDPDNDDLVRIGILTLQILVFSTITSLLLESDPALRAMPGYYTLVLTATHLNPGLAFGASLSLLVFLGRKCGEIGALKVSERPREKNSASFLRRVTVLLLLVGITNLNFKPRPFLIDTVYNIVAYALLERIQPTWCRYLQDASRNDDHYVLSVEEPTNGPENYFSVLKLKTRIATGAFNPEQMTIGTAPDLSSGDDKDQSVAGSFAKARKAVQEHFGAYDCVSRT
jgi:hypothetical protein